MTEPTLKVKDLGTGRLELTATIPFPNAQADPWHNRPRYGKFIVTATVDQSAWEKSASFRGMVISRMGL